MRMEKDGEGNIIAASGKVSELRAMNSWVKGCCVSVWGEKRGSEVYKSTCMSLTLALWEWVNGNRAES